MSAAGGRAGKAPTLISEQRTMTAAELEELQQGLVGRLLSLGLAPGDRVAVLAANRVELLAVTVGTLRAGIVPVPISPLLTPAERGYLIQDSGAQLLFTDRAPEAEADHVVELDGLDDWVGGAALAELAPITLTRPMHYTSGTTGRPKGVWVAPKMPPEAAELSRRFRVEWGLGPTDVHLVCSPLTHSGPHRYALRTLEAGGAVVIQERFDSVATLAAIEHHGATSTFMVPTHLERIFRLHDDELARHELSSLKLLAHAGAPIRRETKRRAQELFPEGSVWEFYGSTEGGFTRIAPSEALAHPGSVGRPADGARIEIRDPADGHLLPPGATGTVWLRDPRAERFEYWGDEAKTARAWDAGAFTVGDHGHLDADGYLYLDGRPGDLIISGGVNVYPAEVEDVLMGHPDVAEALVYGAADEDWGQQVRALVVAAGGAAPDPTSLSEWARSRLAGYKCPRVFEVVGELPRTSTGKIKRSPPG